MLNRSKAKQAPLKDKTYSQQTYSHAQQSKTKTKTDLISDKSTPLATFQRSESSTLKSKTTAFANTKPTTSKRQSISGSMVTHHNTDSSP